MGVLLAEVCNVGEKSRTPTERAALSIHVVSGSSVPSGRKPHSLAPVSGRALETRSSVGEHVPPDIPVRKDRTPAVHVEDRRLPVLYTLP